MIVRVSIILTAVFRNLSAVFSLEQNFTEGEKFATAPTLAPDALDARQLSDEVIGELSKLDVKENGSTIDALLKNISKQKVDEQDAIPGDERLRLEGQKRPRTKRRLYMKRSM